SNWTKTTFNTTAYCTPTSPVQINPLDRIYINSFTTSNGVNNINNTNTGYSTYSNFRNLFATQNSGESLSFTDIIDTGSNVTAKGLAIWIDWNKNAIFDADEKVITTTTLTQRNISGAFDIPQAVATGDYRMRVIVLNNHPTNPCSITGVYAYGEIEDYTLKVINNSVETCVTTTTWNGSSWSNGTPTLSKKAIINGTLILNTDYEACELEVTSNGKLTIPANHSFTVKGKVTNNASVADFVVANNGVLLQIEEGENEGEITVLRNSNPMKRLDYTLWSAPVSGMLLKNFSDVSPAGGDGTLWNRVYILGDNVWNQVWTSYAEAQSGNHTFDSGKAYLYRSKNSYDPVNTVIFEGEFIGVPNNGTIQIATPFEYNGVGNPYPSPIHADDLLTNGVDAVYFWTNTNAPDQNGNYILNNWATYSSVGGTFASNGTLAPNGIIQNGQGFVVKTNDSQLTFTNEMRLATHNGQFFRPMSTERHRYWLNLSDELVVYNQTLVGYIENASEGVDTGIDASMYAYDGNAIYSLIDNSEEKFVIQGRPLPFTATDIVPLGFKAANAGKFSISLDNFDGLFSEGNTIIYLKDNFNNSLHNLYNGAYTFISEEGIYENRFEVIYQTTMSVDNPDMNNTSWNVYKIDNKFFIQPGGFELKEVSMYDILGRKIYTSQASGTTHTVSN